MRTLTLLALACALAIACGDDPSGGSLPSDTDLDDSDATDARLDSDVVADVESDADVTAESDTDARPVDRVAVSAGAYTVTLTLPLTSADAPTLTLARADTPLVVLPADGVQLGFVDRVRDGINYDPYGFAVDDFLHPAPPLAGWEPWSSAQVVAATDTAFSALLRLDGAHVALLTVEALAEGRFHVQLAPALTDAGDVAYVRLRARPDPDEGIYGLGEVFDRVEHRGTVRALQLELDPELPDANNAAHVPVPFVLGTTGWGLFVADEHPGVFDVASGDPERIDAIFSPGVDSAEGVDFYLFGADHPLDLTHHYYAVTDAPGAPAPWALGPWIWRNENDDQAQVVADVNAIRDLDLATTGYWIDRPYATAVNTFDFEAARFPDPAAMLAEMHGLGFAVALWHTPYLDESDPATAALREVAENARYYPIENGPLLNNWGRPLDFTNAGARRFWREQLAYYVDLGVAGFKLDYGEDVVPGLAGGRSRWLFADGRDERTMHAAFQREYHAVYDEVLPEGGGFLLCRGATFGEQVHGLVIWPGDLDATMARHREVVGEGDDEYVAIGGLPAALIAGLSLGPSGFPLYGSDTGGYRHSPPDRETFVRWFEMSALSTVMQVGTGASDVPWELLDDEALGWYRDYARLHLRLFPYLWTYVSRLADDGRPIQRALGLAYPELGVHPSDEYLLGDALLVAPVVERGATERTLMLPPDDWIDWWTGERRSGPGAITVDAALEVLPLFVAAGGLVPLLRPTVDTLVATTEAERVDSALDDPGGLYVVTSPGPATTLALYTGDVLTQETDATGLTLTIRAGSLYTRGPRFEVVALGAAPTGVELDGAEVLEAESAEALDDAESGWFFDAEDRGGTLSVQVPFVDAADEVRVRVERE